MKKNKNYKKLFSFIFMILFLLSFQTIVYSAFSSTMNITGIAHSRVEADVRITDFRIASTNNATSSYENFGKSHIITNIDFTSSSSSITYYLEITNYGSVDVGIFDITGLSSGVSYSIKDYNLHDKICDDSGKCNSFITKTYELTLTSTSAYSGSIQMNFDFRTYHKVSYTDIENKGYPVDVIDGGNLIISFKEDLERVQVLSNNTELGYYKNILNGTSINFSNILSDVELKIKPRAAKLVKGNINEAGSEVCISDECFYIISNDGSTIAMLAKYNLYVGGKYENSTWTAYEDEATGRQDPTMLGYVLGQSVRNGTVNFSATKYWEEVSRGTYIYDSNSLLYQYVENYKTYLESQGVVLKEARLIKYNELKSLGCSNNSTCPSAPSWVYGTSYWTGSFYDEDNVYAVGSRGNFGRNIYSDSSDCGVRPVVEIDVDEISPVRVISGDYDTVGSEVCISDECFYVISSDEDSVTMLAKYNLEVGNVCTSSSSCTLIENPSGIQDSEMIGYPTDGSYPRYGTTAFSSTNYWYSGGLKVEYGTSYPAYVYDSNSTLYNYVESYRTYLESQGAEIEEARLIRYEELTALGCSSVGSCKSAPEWVYGTSYWSGAALGSDSVWRVTSNGEFNSNIYSYSSNRGVRPVIVLKS